MSIFRNYTIVEWHYKTVLLSGATLTLPVGMEFSPVTMVKAHDFTFMTWGIYSSHTWTFQVQGSQLATFATSSNLVNFACAAGTFYEPYDLAAPRGDSGFIVLTKPFIRVRAIETAGTDHTRTEIYVKAWT